MENWKIAPFSGDIFVFLRDSTTIQLSRMRMSILGMMTEHHGQVGNIFFKKMVLILFFLLGEKLHQVDIPEDATNWQKIYQRGVQMRRNMVDGR